MRIEQVSLDKVRVMLSPKDLADMNIDPKMFFSDSSVLQTFILHILEEIHRKTDFNPYHGNLTMEAMPGEDDSMSILLSKGAELKLPDADKITAVNAVRAEKNRGKIRSIKAVKKENNEEKKANKENGAASLVFAAFEDMCGAISRMSAKGLEMSELYDTDEGYTLIIPVTAETMDDFAVLMEFSADVRRMMRYEYIREHDKLIADGQRLAGMAEGIKNLNKI